MNCSGLHFKNSNFLAKKQRAKSKRAKEQKSKFPTLIKLAVEIAIHSWSLFCEEWREQFAQGHSFSNISWSDLLPPLFKTEQREWFALGHKMGKSSEKLSKTWWKHYIFLRNHSFFENEREIMSELLLSLYFEEQLERLALATLLYRATRTIHSWSLFFFKEREWIAQGCTLKIAILSKRAKSKERKSKRVNSQHW